MDIPSSDHDSPHDRTSGASSRQSRIARIQQRSPPLESPPGSRRDLLDRSTAGSYHHPRGGNLSAVDEDEPEAEINFHNYIATQRALRARHRRANRRGTHVFQSGQFGAGHGSPGAGPGLRRLDSNHVSPTDENPPSPDHEQHEAALEPAPAARRKGRKKSARRRTMAALMVVGNRNGESEEWKTYLGGLDNSQLCSLDEIKSVYDDDEEENAHCRLDAFHDEGSNAEQSHHTHESHHEHEKDGHGDHAHHRHSHSLILPFYCPPVQRQLWDDDQVLPHVNWYDLFFDLIFVSAAFNLGGLIISAMNKEDWPRGLLYYVAMFGPVYSIWESDVIYASRYTVVDYSHRLLAVLRFLFVSFAVLSIKPLDLLSDKSSAETFTFTLSLFGESMVQLVLNLELYLLGDGDRKAIKNQTLRETLFHTLPMSLTYLAAAIISGVSLFTAGGKDYSGNDTYGSEEEPKDDPYNKTDASMGYPPSAPQNSNHRFLAEDYSNDEVDDAGFHWSIADLPLLLCLCIYVFDIIFSLFHKWIQTMKAHDVREYFVPNNIDYMIHRYGEWTMLMIGESILSLLIGEPIESAEYYAVTILGCLTVIILQMLKYESEPVHADGHALWRNMRAASLYSILIQILSMGLIAFGVSYKVQLKDVYYEYKPKDATYERMLSSSYATPGAVAWLFCASLGTVLLSLEGMMATHKGIRATFQLLFRYREEDPQKRSVNWPLTILFVLKVGLIGATVPVALWLSDPLYVSASGLVIVTSMATLRIVGWAFVNHEEHIYSVMNNVQQTFMGNLAKSITDSLHEEIDATSRSTEERRASRLKIDHSAMDLKIAWAGSTGSTITVTDQLWV